jgi:hypothetical protein
LFKEAIRIVDRIDNEFFEVSGCQLKEFTECFQAILALNQSNSEVELLPTN